MSGDRTTVRLADDLRDDVERVRAAEQKRHVLLTQAGTIDLLLRRGVAVYRNEAEKLGTWDKVIG